MLEILSGDSCGEDNERKTNQQQNSTWTLGGNSNLSIFLSNHRQYKN